MELILSEEDFEVMSAEVDAYVIQESIPFSVFEGACEDSGVRFAAI